MGRWCGGRGRNRMCGGGRRKSVRGGGGGRKRVCGGGGRKSVCGGGKRVCGGKPVQVPNHQSSLAQHPRCICTREEVTALHFPPVGITEHTAHWIPATQISDVHKTINSLQPTTYCLEQCYFNGSTIIKQDSMD